MKNEVFDIWLKTADTIQELIDLVEVLIKKDDLSFTRTNLILQKAYDMGKQK
jgi:hypothetical protein